MKLTSGLEKSFYSYNMDSEYKRYLFVQKVRNITPSYEYRNIIERWVLSMANLTVKKRPDPVFVKTTLEEPINQKMMQELIEKRIIPNEEDARSFVEKLIKMTDRFIKSPGAVLNGKNNGPGVVELNRGTVKYKTFSFCIPEPRMRLLLEIAEYNSAPDPEEAVARMVMRYASLGLGSQQWTVPFRNYQHLYKKYGVRVEGFSSPINSQLLAVNYRDTKICTLFPDTDHWFNSIGPFFEAPIENTGLVVNPPFIEDILARAAERCVELGKKKSVLSFYIMPAWKDSEAFDIVEKESDYYVDLKKNTYQYSDSVSNKYIKAKFKSIMAVFGGKSNEDYSNMTDGFVIS